MEAERQHCDCKLSLLDAIRGDLPGVCIWCGDSTDRFYPVPLIRWWRVIYLRLPLCGSDKNHWRWRTWTVLASYLGLFLCLIGFLAAKPMGGRPSATPAGLVALVTVYACGFGLLLFLGCVGDYLILLIRGVHIRRHGRETVTLSHVAPEFIEAYRVHRQRMFQPIVLPVQTPLSTAVESAGPDLLFGEEALHVIEATRLAASTMGHDHVGTKHLLVALRVINTPAARALEALGLDTEHLRQVCRQTVSPVGNAIPAAELPATPAIRRTLNQAAREATNRKHSTVRVSHLLLALLRKPENEAAQILLEMGVAPEDAERRVVEAIQFLEGVMVKDESIIGRPGKHP